jgi:hypothetical protein
MLLFLWNGVVRVPFVSIAKSPLAQLVFGCLSATITFGVAVLVDEFASVIAASREIRVWADMKGRSPTRSVTEATLQLGSWQRILLRGLLFSSESGYVVVASAKPTSDRST